MWQRLLQGGSGQKIKVDTFTNTSSGVTINVGFKPRTLCMITSTNNILNYYDENISTNNFYFGASGTTVSFTALGGTKGSRLKSINDNGFTINGGNVATYNYVAIG